MKKIFKRTGIIILLTVLVSIALFIYTAIKNVSIAYSANEIYSAKKDNSITFSVYQNYYLYRNKENKTFFSGDFSAGDYEQGNADGQYTYANGIFTLKKNGTIFGYVDAKGQLQDKNKKVISTGWKVGEATIDNVNFKVLAGYKPLKLGQDEIVMFPSLKYTNGIYCIRQGVTYSRGLYECYEMGTIDEKTAYIIYELESMHKDIRPYAERYSIQDTNPAQIYVWNGIDGSIDPKILKDKIEACDTFIEEYNKNKSQYSKYPLYNDIIKQRLQDIENIQNERKNKDHDVNITSEDNKTFKITYPTATRFGSDGEETEGFVGLGMRIWLNNWSILYIEENPNGRYSFVNCTGNGPGVQRLEFDTSIPGEIKFSIPENLIRNENKIEVTYYMMEYSGTYAKFKNMSYPDAQSVISYDITTNYVSTTTKYEFNKEKQEDEFILNIEKKDTAGNILPNIKFKIDLLYATVKSGAGLINSNVIGGTYEFETDSEGKAHIVITPCDDAYTYDVLAEITEEENGDYEDIDPVIIEWKYSNNKWTAGCLLKDKNTKIDFTGSTVELDITNTPKEEELVLNILKTDNNNKPLKDMEFGIMVDNGEVISEVYSDDEGILDGKFKTDSEGKAQIVIKPYKGRTNVLVWIEETSSKDYLDIEPIVVEFHYRDNKWSAVQLNGTSNVTFSENTLNLNIVNTPKINLKINKSTYPAGELLADVKFRVELVNARFDDGTPIRIVTTDSNGEIDLGSLEVLNPNIKVKLTEIGTPDNGLNYNGLNGKTVTVEFNTKTKGDPTSDVNFYVQPWYDNESNTLQISVINDLTIDISGKVWLDGQTGLKPVNAPNSKYDDGESILSGITVKLYRKEQNSSVFVAKTVTDSNGCYSFTVPQTANKTYKYFVEFTYDGVNYIAVKPNSGSDETIDSDAEEIMRAEFNGKFNTITKEGATSGIGDPIKLEYILNDKSAELQTQNNNVLKDEFAMRAQTIETYSETTKNVDLGLVRKGVDLAAVTEIKSAKVSINGKTNTYSRDTIIGMEYNIVNEENEITYNINLYNSDYNYRIKDYSKLPELKSTRETGPILGNELEDPSALLEKKKADGELEVELTYQIILTNESATDARINSIAYYYDPSLILVFATEQIEDATIDGKEYKKVIIPIPEDKKFDGSNNLITTEVTFELDKDSNGVNLGDKKNWVEIISYSAGGCIDVDSAPDNITEHFKEDDSDDANIVKVQVDETAERTISGYVFEDLKASGVADGVYQDTENKIDNVIVQLIEIKEVEIDGETHRLEYIWQETNTGSNILKYISSDGKNIVVRDDMNNEKGQYTFTDFIPGNYIVRFIYGDGTYYDVSTEEGKASILRYNGQDYKSTIDKNYKEPIFKASLYEENASMAKDNEARRLEEMSNATSGKDLQNLKNTWMCADTSDVNVNGVVVENSTNYNINFGLVKRPEITLNLEKHVTSLKIDGIVDAFADINDYYTPNHIVKYTENIGGLRLATATNKDEGENNGGNSIGSWQVQADLSQLQGKKMDIVYTYMVKATGDKEYISSALSKKLEENSTNASGVYSSLASKVKNEYITSNYNSKVGQYLGEAYYSGNKGQNDVELIIPVQIEDYLNNNQNGNIESDTFEIKDSTTKKDIIDNLGKDNEETVTRIQSNVQNIKVGGGSWSPVLKINQIPIDSTSEDDLTYRSYAAQLIGQSITQTGLTFKNSSFGNLKYVQSYTTAVRTTDVVPETDEFIGETIIIAKPTGEDRQTPMIFIITIAAGMTIIATGAILIKKFVIK